MTDIAIDRDVGQPGEMRQSTRDRSLMFGREHVIGDDIPPTRARKIFATVEDAVFHPACRDVAAAAGVGARRMARNQVVDFEAVFDGADPVFEGGCGHRSIHAFGWAEPSGTQRYLRGWVPGLAQRARPSLRLWLTAAG